MPTSGASFLRAIQAAAAAPAAPASAYIPTQRGRDRSTHTSTSSAGFKPSSPLQPRHVLCCHRDGGVGAQLPADSAEAGRLGVRFLGALLGCRRRDEPGVGDCRRPVLPVAVGVLLEAGEHRELAVQQHPGLRYEEGGDDVNVWASRNHNRSIHPAPCASESATAFSDSQELKLVRLESVLVRPVTSLQPHLQTQCGLRGLLWGGSPCTNTGACDSWVVYRGSKPPLGCK